MWFIRALSPGAVGRAVEAGTLLVAARETAGELCYPGCLSAAFGVGLDWECPRNRFRYRQAEGVLYASGYPRPIPGIPRSHNLRGISFAVANMTAFIARACETMHAPLRDQNRVSLTREALHSESALINACG
jgi:hypothetical protein